MTKIQLRRGTAAQWTTANTVLLAGEAGFETDTGKLKIGDGTTAWTSLAYQNLSGPQGPAGIASATSPITVTGPTGAQTIGIDQAAITIAESQVTNLTTDLAAKAPLISPSFTTPSLGAATASSISTSEILLKSTAVGTSEGGQLNFARSSDDSQYWYVDSYGSTSTPDLRVVEGSSERARFTAGGGLAVDGTISTQGHKIFIQSSTPGSPAAGDVWIWY